MHFSSPKTLAEATADMARGGRKVLAGGTDLFPALRDRPSNMPIVDLSRIDGLRGIFKTETDWRLGACTTWSDIARAELPACFRGLQMAAREIGSLQIQNAGTIAGNLCNASPAADSVPALLALDARIEIASDRGNRILPLSEFILGVRRTALQPDEIVSAILVPNQTSVSSFLKLGARKYLVISIAMVAANLTLDTGGTIRSVRIAVGACSPVAQRLFRLETELGGVKANERAIRDCLRPDCISTLSPIDDVRADREYRLEAARELVARVLTDCVVQANGDNA